MNGRWDLVLFMGVFYHLGYPLLGLDIVAEKVGRYLVFQSAATGKRALPKCQGMSISRPWRNSSARHGRIWHSSKTRFVTTQPIRGVPNRSAVAGMLRSSGMRIETAVDADTVICSPDGSKGARDWNKIELLAATGTGKSRRTYGPAGMAFTPHLIAEEELASSLPVLSIFPLRIAELRSSARNQITSRFGAGLAGKGL